MRWNNLKRDISSCGWLKIVMLPVWASFFAYIRPSYPKWCSGSSSWGWPWRNLTSLSWDKTTIAKGFVLITAMLYILIHDNLKCRCLSAGEWNFLGVDRCGCDWIRGQHGYRISVVLLFSHNREESIEIMVFIDLNLRGHTPKHMNVKSTKKLCNQETYRGP